MWCSQPTFTNMVKGFFENTSHLTNAISHFEVQLENVTGNLFAISLIGKTYVRNLGFKRPIVFPIVPFFKTLKRPSLKNLLISLNRKLSY